MRDPPWIFRAKPTAPPVSTRAAPYILDSVKWLDPPLLMGAALCPGVQQRLRAEGAKVDLHPIGEGSADDARAELGVEHDLAGLVTARAVVRDGSFGDQRPLHLPHRRVFGLDEERV